MRCPYYNVMITMYNFSSPKTKVNQFSTSDFPITPTHRSILFLS